MAIRVLPVNTPVIEQVDFFQGDFYTRIGGLTTSNITIQAFYNNQLMSWPTVSGNGVADDQVKSGFVYFNELSVAGFYGIRFRPNVMGFWRIVVNYPVGVQTVALDFDILTPIEMTGGLKAQFVRP